ncbi:response regulator [Caulobacter segnis]
MLRGRDPGGQPRPARRTAASCAKRFGARGRGQPHDPNCLSADSRGGPSCQVTLASNGEEAVEAVTEGKFDLCLMDLRMPKMDGFAAIKAIRNLPKSAGLPVYAVSADLLDGLESARATCDFDGFLPKPLRPELILALVRDVSTRAA